MNVFYLTGLLGWSALPANAALFYKTYSPSERLQKSLAVA